MPLPEITHRLIIRNSPGNLPANMTQPPGQLPVMQSPMSPEGIEVPIGTPVNLVAGTLDANNSVNGWTFLGWTRIPIAPGQPWITVNPANIISTDPNFTYIKGAGNANGVTNIFAAWEPME